VLFKDKERLAWGGVSLPGVLRYYRQYLTSQALPGNPFEAVAFGAPEPHLAHSWW